MGYSSFKEDGGELTKSNVSAVEEALKGMVYPRRKHEIVDYARQHNASKSIISNLENIPDKAYMGPEEISRELGSDQSSQTESPSEMSGASRQPFSSRSEEEPSSRGSSQSFGGRGGE